MRKKGKIYAVKLIVPRGFRRRYEGITKAKDGSVEAIIPSNYMDAMLRDLGFQPERRRQRFREKPAKDCIKKREKRQAEPPDSPLPFEGKKEPQS